jgi:Alr-MurF fusion protein
MIHFSDLQGITNGDVCALSSDRRVTTLLTDSRKAIVQEGSVFFAIAGSRHDGHQFIPSLYAAGIHQFVVEKDVNCESLPLANILRVQSTIHALQQIVRHHREQFSLPIIGITGSNAKTITKEWLFQLLSADREVIKNPGSYNSQIGVPLSVWQIQPHHTTGIFEAGISRPGEMEKLQQIIQPTIGIFTNIGTAHDENFPDRTFKIQEKLKLFSRAQRLIYCADHAEVHSMIKKSSIPSLSWGPQHADVPVRFDTSGIVVTWNAKTFRFQLPFTDSASQENALHCVVTMLALGYTPAVIKKRLHVLQAVPMRLELKEGINQCVIIDDTYNNDLGGLRISLDFLNHQQQRSKKTLILSDIQESGLSQGNLVNRIAELVNHAGLSRFIGIGPGLLNHQHLFTIPSAFYQSTEQFLENAVSDSFSQEVILIKGARVYEFERIVRRLQKKQHGTIMEIDLGSLVHNLNYFKSWLKPTTKIMAMVKAFAYGSGSVTIANVLQYHNVNYLGVAYADEGVELRQNNITLPVMVMNTSTDSFQQLVDYHLEPEIFSFGLLQSLIGFLQGRTMRIHLKIDTGMHRLGFEEDEIDALIDCLSSNRNIQLASIYSHLAGADEAIHDAFSNQQAARFISDANRLKRELQSDALVHLLNTPGILRFPQYQFDMVRLGIGLYGIDPSKQSALLKPVASLKTVVSQVKMIKQGETIGYGRKGRAEQDMQLATIAIGYADGFSRAFSQGKGKVMIQGKRAPVVGNVCMDMTMVDCTGIPVKEGDEVTVFGATLPIQEVAESIHTIPYEILTNTSDRVKRIFVAESL